MTWQRLVGNCKLGPSSFIGYACSSLALLFHLNADHGVARGKISSLFFFFFKVGNE
ncbi:hypothetical protein K469DRAFT_259491 [Zopfia rhizophila CBS 207.26]|uniref:Uncharacterized protein n=1 Tax=Zopfia rhizophila CBS 207.26 TaxID=1314779 RepID=A0A6A6DR38_9PEZI|nr:hypothetical protein K469DRAFT_259491 [Zopfia rhizophila CBS 207.26]